MGLTKRQKERRTPLISSRSLFCFPPFNWKTQGAPSISRYKQLNSWFCILLRPPLLCWINHFTPVINRWTNGRMSIPSNYWFTDVYFLRENYETFELCWFLLFVCLFGLFLPLSFWIFKIFFARGGGFLWDWSPTHHHRHRNKTLEFRETTHTHAPAHAHIYKYLCYCNSEGLIFSQSETINPRLDVVESPKWPDICIWVKPNTYITSGSEEDRSGLSWTTLSATSIYRNTKKITTLNQMRQFTYSSKAYYGGCYVGKTVNNMM